MLKNVFLRYLIYIVYFLGIGMVSSGIVLMPFNTVRYGSILIIGLILFSTGSFVNEVILEKKQLTSSERFKLVFLSLSLAIGIGMISGGIAHFKESPVYVTYLIPLGMIISFVSYVFKNGYKFSKREVAVVSVILLITALTTHTGLSFAAAQLGFVETSGDVFKSHGM